MTKKSVLSACVSRMKNLGLTGKLRDDAAGHFFAGAVAADPSLASTRDAVKAGGYLAVLEALADSEIDQPAAEIEADDADDPF